LAKKGSYPLLRAVICHGFSSSVIRHSTQTDRLQMQHTHKTMHIPPIVNARRLCIRDSCRRKAFIERMRRANRGCLTAWNGDCVRDTSASNSVQNSLDRRQKCRKPRHAVRPDRLAACNHHTYFESFSTTTSKILVLNISERKKAGGRLSPVVTTKILDTPTLLVLQELRTSTPWARVTSSS
jgi:hypothetical protein